MRPTITVVIPVFNVALYVERCVQSVMRQSYPAAECIIVDDASTDDSIQRCERLIADFKGTTRFIVLHHKKTRVYLPHEINYRLRPKILVFEEECKELP